MLLNLSDPVVHGDFVRLKWEIHIKYSGALTKFNQLHLTITKQEQRVQSPHATTTLPPYPRWGLFWQPMARLSVQESKQKNPTSCHHMVFYWNFISPDSLNSLLSSPPRPVWCYDATIQSLWLGTVSMVMSSDVITGGLLQDWMKSGTRCTLPPYISGGGGQARGHISENGKPNHRRDGKGWPEGEKVPIPSTQ